MKFLFKSCRLPDFLIIGTQKGGTTTLFEYLSLHPDFCMPAKKEIHYFDLQYHEGLRWYKRHFDKRSIFKFCLMGEASPYYFFHPQVPQRIARDIPAVKLILLLRDPVERAWSHFHHERRHGTEPVASFMDAIKLENSRVGGEEEKLVSGLIKQSRAHQCYSYISRGLYFNQLERWLKYFDFNQFFFIKSEDFYREPLNQLESILEFLGGDKTFNFDLLAPLNANQHPEIPVEIRETLLPLFAEDSKKLSRLIGKKFTWD